MGGNGGINTETTRVNDNLSDLLKLHQTKIKEIKLSLAEPILGCNLTLNHYFNLISNAPSVLKYSSGNSDTISDKEANIRRILTILKNLKNYIEIAINGGVPVKIYLLNMHYPGIGINWINRDYLQIYPTCLPVNIKYIKFAFSIQSPPQKLYELLLQNIEEKLAHNPQNYPPMGTVMMCKNNERSCNGQKRGCTQRCVQEYIEDERCILLTNESYEYIKNKAIIALRTYVDSENLIDDAKMKAALVGAFDEFENEINTIFDKTANQVLVQIS